MPKSSRNRKTRNGTPRQKTSVQPTRNKRKATQGGALDPRLQKIVAKHEAGQLEQARADYLKYLETAPDDAQALHFYGILLLQTGESPTATIGILARAAEGLPQDPKAHMHYGIALQNAGYLSEAEAQFREVLEIKPNYAEAHNNLGANLVKQGRPEDAAECFDAALEIDPQHAAAERNRTALLQTSSADEALEAKGDQLAAAERFAEARDCYAQAFAAAPDNEALFYKYCRTLRHGGYFDEAQSLLSDALKRRPEDRRLIVEQAVLSYQQGAYDEALTYVDRISTSEDLPYDIDHIRANSLRYLSRTEEAEAAYQRAMEAHPERSDIRNDYGVMLFHVGRFADASMELLQVVSQDPENRGGYGNLGNTLKDQGRVFDAFEIYQQALEVFPNDVPLYSNMLLCLNYINGLSNESCFQAHRDFAKRIARSTTPFDHQRTGDPHKVLRVGFVSADFRKHSVTRFFLPLLENLDRTQVEVFLYSNVKRPDKVSADLENLADHWRSIHGMQDDRTAQTIYEDGIDILIELNGHTGDHRLELMDRKPAPIQMSWLGYPNTTGLSTIDYRIVDEVVEPKGHAEPYSTEKLLHLPNGFHCFRPPEEADEVAPSPAQKNGFVTFGSFNYLGKINEDVVRTWSEILRRVPDSRLLLKARGLGDVLSNEVYLSLFEKYGVTRDRIMIAPFTRTTAEHLKLYDQVDIALDPFPYNGTTTTCEALWMGVPVVALLGPTHAARVSASLLHRLDLEQLIGASLDDYVEKAVALASNVEDLAQLRERIRPTFEASPLRDEAGFARDFTAALQGVWQDWCGNGAAAKDVQHATAPAAAAKGQDTAAQSANTRPQEIRVLHHLARTGGTLISKCLGSMDDVLLLSEAHPLGMQWIDPIQQAQQWFGLISREEADEIRNGAAPFDQLVELAERRSRERGKHLVIRDWTHLDYTGAPFIARPSYELTTAKRVAALCDRVVATTTVRHPIDEWLSVNNLALVNGKLSLRDYLYGYRAFAEAAVDIGFVRYEDFTTSPDQVLQTLCERLRLPFDPGYQSRWASYNKITGDTGPSSQQSAQIRPTRRKNYDADLLATFKADENYLSALKLLGYEHPVAAVEEPVASS